MSDTETTPDQAVAELRARAETLERELARARADAEARLVRAELKAEAVRAGIVDLDGLKLIDASGLRPDEDGGVGGAAEAIAVLKRNKPWLFAGASSSAVALPPAAQPARRKTALEMTDAEWRAARAELTRRRY